MEDPLEVKKGRLRGLLATEHHIGHSPTRLNEDYQRHKSLATYLNLQLHSFAEDTILIAALLAPVSWLLDIPALSMDWYIGHPSETGSLILSAIGLAFDFVGNTLLVMRFLDNEFCTKHWRILTDTSSLSWMLKNLLALVNIGVYTRASVDGGPAIKSEGFWAAVISVILSGIISILLIINFLFYKAEANFKTRLQGKHYILSLTSLIFLLALMALVFSRIEDWTYLDGLYFSVVTITTIGYGDKTPTKSLAKVLDFFFLLTGVIVLANMITVTSTYAKAKLHLRRQIWRKSFEHDKIVGAFNDEGAATLDHQYQILLRINREEHRYWSEQDMAAAVAVLLLFWILGAVAFSQIEGWGIGTGFYFGYITFSTCGYGDVTPVTPAGRVLFVLYGLAAVPIVTTLCLSVLSQSYQDWLTSLRVWKRNFEDKMEHASTELEHFFFSDHHELVERHHKVLANEIPALKRESLRKVFATGLTKEQLMQRLEDHEQQIQLFQHIIDLVFELEDEARALLMEEFAEHDIGFVLKADRINQITTLAGHGVAVRMTPPPVKDKFERVSNYRATFAAILAAASRYRDLAGDDQLIFERRPKGSAVVDHQHIVK